MNMIVRNLPRFITEKELLAMFLPFGKVSAHNLVKEAGTGQSKGFGFVEMPENAEAAAAIRELNNKLIGGQKIRVKAASQRDEAPFERRDRPQQDRIERRFTSGSVRTEARGARRPAGGGGRDFATPQRSESRDGTGATWTRSTAAEGGSRTGRTSGQSPSRHTKTPGRESGAPQRSESRDGTGATWTRSRAAEGASRTGRPAERGSTQPARPGGSYRSRFEKTELQGIDRPFRGGSTGRPSERGATQPARPESKYRARPAKTGSQETAKPFHGGITADSRPAKRTGRTPARPIKIGRSGARQNKPARKGKP